MSTPKKATGDATEAQEATDTAPDASVEGKPRETPPEGHVKPDGSWAKPR